jgi:hypothetical protein
VSKMIALLGSPEQGDAVNDLTDILDQRDRDYCIAGLRSRWSMSGDDVCGAGGR